jgi:hypothetical protein
MTQASAFRSALGVLALTEINYTNHLTRLTTRVTGLCFIQHPFVNFRTVYGNTEKHMAQMAQPLYSRAR